MEGQSQRCQRLEVDLANAQARIIELAAEQQHLGGLLEAVLRQMPVAVIIAEAPSGRLIVANHWVQGILRQPFTPIQSIQEYALHRAFHPDGRPYEPHDWPLARSVAKGEEVVNEEIRLLRGDGSYCTILASSSPIRDEADRIVAGVLTFKDITDIKTTEEALRVSEERLRLATSAASEAIWDWDIANTRVSWNKTYQDAFGRPADTAASTQWWVDHLHPEDRQRVVSSIQAALESGGNLWVCEYRFMRADGNWAEIYDRSFIARDASGKATRAVGAMLDVTAQKQAQAALRKARDELEEKVRERTAELSNTVAVLQAEVQERIRAQDALGRQTEQLRRLTAQLALAEQRERRRLAELLHDHLQQLLAGAKYQLGRLERTADAEVKRTVREVQGLLAQCLYASRTLTGELSPPVLHEGGLIPGLEWLARWMQEKHGLEVRVEAQEDASPENEDLTLLLFHAVRELLFNVVKHARTDKASVRLRRMDDLIQIEVTDEGAGFDPARLYGQGVDSAGLGLMGIRERLSMLGGRIEVRSAPGRGSHFVLLAPISTP